MKAKILGIKIEIHKKSNRPQWAKVNSNLKR